MVAFGRSGAVGKLYGKGTPDARAGPLLPDRSGERKGLRHVNVSRSPGSMHRVYRRGYLRFGVSSCLFPKSFASLVAAFAGIRESARLNSGECGYKPGSRFTKGTSRRASE